MKKKTITNKKSANSKMSKLDIDKAKAEQLKKDFKEMRKNNDYSEMGEMFFFIFATEKENLYRKTAGKLWDSLTEEEQMMCENY